MNDVSETFRTAFVAALLASSAGLATEPITTPPAAADTEHPPAPAADKPAEKAEKKWYERLALRGYTQIRYNRLGQTNPEYRNDQGDKSLGGDNGLTFRRARLIIYGDVADFLYVYLQSDFASIVNDQLHVPTIKDWYADISFDSKKEFRLRLGQSKVPYGFENMQSSQNRLPFDRSDAINSAMPNERDIGLFFYWAPHEIRARFKHLVESGLKGSGDYGVVALGVFNGQGANQKERNVSLSAVARLTWPFQIGNQILEVGGGGYAGRFTIKKDSGIEGPGEFDDMRAEAAVVLYPQPVGFQAEYNVGVGPALNGTAVRESFLQGGYAMLFARLWDFSPYVRGSYYDGGKKFETNAPHYLVREIEAGVEWQPAKALELTAAYMMGDRTSPHSPYSLESGRTVRLQAQFNY